MFFWYFTIKHFIIPLVYPDNVLLMSEIYCSVSLYIKRNLITFLEVSFQVCTVISKRHRPTFAKRDKASHKKYSLRQKSHHWTGTTGIEWIKNNWNSIFIDSCYQHPTPTTKKVFTSKHRKIKVTFCSMN